MCYRSSHEFSISILSDPSNHFPFSDFVHVLKIFTGTISLQLPDRQVYLEFQRSIGSRFSNIRIVDKQKNGEFRVIGSTPNSWHLLPPREQPSDFFLSTYTYYAYQWVAYSPSYHQHQLPSSRVFLLHIPRRGA